MRVGDAIQRLEAYQTRIDAVLTRTGRALDVTPRDPVALAHLRWELLRLLREYQLFKHGELFEPLLRGGDAGRRMRAATLKDRCLAMAEVVTEHTQRWTVAGTADAGSYTDEARALLVRLVQHLSEERSGVAHLLDGVLRTRQA